MGLGLRPVFRNLIHTQGIAMRRIKKCVKERGYFEGTYNELGHEQSIVRRKCMATCMGLLQLLGFRNLEKMREHCMVA